jgi:hypothetical protein
MAKYFARSCPRCNGYVGIIMREPERDLPLQAVNGHCVRCAYRLAWIVIRGGRQRVNRRAISPARHAPPGAGL